jgi:hypothetical protein
VSQREEYVSFEKALRDLRLRSEELRKLVSEGDIRAFRDGDSMKFRMEDVAALAARKKGEEELAFADALEDDTGMVTEELSAEDTLLADDEPEVAPAVTTVRSTTTTTTSRRAARPAVVVDKSREPKWVTATAILGAVILIWGFMICYSISQGADPAGNFFTRVFAEQKAK